MNEWGTRVALLPGRPNGKWYPSKSFKNMTFSVKDKGYSFYNAYSIVLNVFLFNAFKQESFTSIAVNFSIEINRVCFRVGLLRLHWTPCFREENIPTIGFQLKLVWVFVSTKLLWKVERVGFFFYFSFKLYNLNCYIFKSYEWRETEPIFKLI